jgi:hypothetical protein
VKNVSLYEIHEIHRLIHNKLLMSSNFPSFELQIYDFIYCKILHLIKAEIHRLVTRLVKLLSILTFLAVYRIITAK